MNFRDLPSIDTLLRSRHLVPLIAAHGVERTKNVLRTLQAEWRSSGELPDWANDDTAYAQVVHETLNKSEYRAVFNLKPNAGDAHELLWNSGICYEKGKSLGVAIQAFQRLQRTFPKTLPAKKALAKLAK